MIDIPADFDDWSAGKVQSRKLRRILVCGGRDFDDFEVVYVALAPFIRSGVTTIIHGGARGADDLAGQFAALWSLAVEVYPADWDTHGRAAGPIRNKQMLEEGKPDLVIAFPGGKGTANMIGQAKEAGIPVREIEAKVGA